MLSAGAESPKYLIKEGVWLGCMLNLDLTHVFGSSELQVPRIWACRPTSR